jgi:hypothetical protein
MRIAVHTDSARRDGAVAGRYRSYKLSREACLVLGLAPCLAASACDADRGRAAPVQLATASKTVPLTITWEMAERFGPRLDCREDGRPDLPNSSEYLNPGRYEVRLTASLGRGASADDEAGMSCEWRIDGANQVIALRADGPSSTVCLPEGTYGVTADVRLPDGRTGSARETVRVEDRSSSRWGTCSRPARATPRNPPGGSWIDRWPASRSSAGGSTRPGRRDGPTAASMTSMFSPAGCPAANAS